MYRNVPLLYRIMESFFRYRTLFLVVAVIVTVIPGAILLTRKPTYTSTSMVQVISPDVSAVTGEGRTSWTPVSQQNVNQFNDWLNDDSPGGFIDSALQKAKLNRPINVDPRSKDPRLAQLRKGLNLGTSSDTVFTINLVWDNPAECEQIVKSMQDQYIEQTGVEKQLQSKNITEFLDSEIEKYAIRLRIAEKAVRDFKMHNAGQSQEAQIATIDQLSNLRNQLNDMEVSSQNNSIKRTEILNRLHLIKPTSIQKTTVTTKEDPLVIRKNQLDAERTKLLIEGWLKTSTRVQALDAQIKSTQEEIDTQAKADPDHTKGVQSDVVIQDNPEYRELQTQLNEATINENTDKAQIVQLRTRIGEYEKRLAQLPKMEADLDDRLRDANILKAQYEDLAKRREQSLVKKSLDKVAAVSTLHGLGTVYAQPTGGKGKTTMMLAGLLVFGLILGVGVTVLAEWADPTVRYAADVERRLGVPVLISLPEMAPLLMAAPSSSSSDGEMSGGGGRPLLPARDE